MKQIKKWLEENRIEYKYEEKGKIKFIFITLEKNCKWINKYNELMIYDKTITINQDVYKTYNILEQYDYNMTRKLKTSTKSDIIIEVLDKRLFKK